MTTNQQETTEERLQVVFSVVRNAAVTMQRLGTHISAATVELQKTTTEELCFLCGPCRGIISWKPPQQQSDSLCVLG
jgi:hypothetical protein